LLKTASCSVRWELPESAQSTVFYHRQFGIF
jgi:hypothetical protein